MMNDPGFESETGDANPYRSDGDYRAPSPDEDGFGREMAVLRAGPIQPMRLMSLTWSALRANSVGLVVIALVAYLPGNILQALSNWSGAPAGKTVFGQIRGAMFLDSFLGVLATMAIVVMMHGRLKGEFIDGPNALGRSLRLWPHGFLAAFLSGMAMAIGFIALVIPGIALAVFFMFDTSAVAVRNQRGRAALGYSMDLVRGRWWWVFGRVLLLLLPLIAVVFVLSMPSAILEPDTLKLFNSDFRLTQQQNTMLTFATETCTDILLVLWYNTGLALLFLNLENTRPVVR